VDLGKPDNTAQGQSSPVMPRRATHCIVARSSRIPEG